MKKKGKIKNKRKGRRSQTLALPSCLLSQQQCRRQFRYGVLADHMSPFSNCSSFTLLQRLKICKNCSVSLYEIELSCGICKRPCLCIRCIRQSATRCISTIYTITTDLSKSSSLSLFLNCFLFRTPTFCGRHKN
jgi:hypothetical protein